MTSHEMAALARLGLRFIKDHGLERCWDGNRLPDPDEIDVWEQATAVIKDVVELADELRRPAVVAELVGQALAGKRSLEVLLPSGKRVAVVL